MAPASDHPQRWPTCVWKAKFMPAVEVAGSKTACMHRCPAAVTAAVAGYLILYFINFYLSTTTDSGPSDGSCSDTGLTYFIID
jgi:hypothetical protein